MQAATYAPSMQFESPRFGAGNRAELQYQKKDSLISALLNGGIERIDFAKEIIKAIDECCGGRICSTTQKTNYGNDGKVSNQSCPSGYNLAYNTPNETEAKSLGSSESDAVLRQLEQDLGFPLGFDVGKTNHAKNVQYSAPSQKDAPQKTGYVSTDYQAELDRLDRFHSALKDNRLDNINFTEATLAAIDKCCGGEICLSKYDKKQADIIGTKQDSYLGKLNVGQGKAEHFDADNLFSQLEAELNLTVKDKRIRSQRNRHYDTQTIMPNGQTTNQSTPQSYADELTRFSDSFHRGTKSSRINLGEGLTDDTQPKSAEGNGQTDYSRQFAASDRSKTNDVDTFSSRLELRTEHATDTDRIEDKEFREKVGVVKYAQQNRPQSQHVAYDVRKEGSLRAQKSNSIGNGISYSGTHADNLNDRVENVDNFKSHPIRTEVETERAPIVKYNQQTNTQNQRTIYDTKEDRISRPQTGKELRYTAEYDNANTNAPNGRIKNQNNFDFDSDHAQLSIAKTVSIRDQLRESGYTYTISSEVSSNDKSSSPVPSYLRTGPTNKIEENKEGIETLVESGAKGKVDTVNVSRIADLATHGELQATEAQHPHATSNNYSRVISQNLDSRVQAAVGKYQASHQSGQDSNRHYANAREVQDETRKQDTNHNAGASLKYREATVANSAAMLELSNVLSDSLDFKIDGKTASDGISVSVRSSYGASVKPESENRGTAKEGAYNQDKVKPLIEQGIEDTQNVKSSAYESKNSGNAESQAATKIKETYSSGAEKRTTNLNSDVLDYRRETTDSDSKARAKEPIIRSEGLERQINAYSPHITVAQGVTPLITTNYQANSRQSENSNKTNYSNSSGLEKQVNSAQVMRYHRLMQNMPDENSLSIRFEYNSYRKKEDDEYRSDSKNKVYSKHDSETQTKAEKKEEEESIAKKKSDKNAKAKNKKTQVRQDNKEIKKIAKEKQDNKKKSKLKVINGGSRSKLPDLLVKLGGIKNGANRSHRKEINASGSAFRTRVPISKRAIAA